MPARVDRANWNGAQVDSTCSMNCLAKVLATNRRNKVPVAMPRTPPCKAVIVANMKALKMPCRPREHATSRRNNLQIQLKILMVPLSNFAQTTKGPTATMWLAETGGRRLESPSTALGPPVAQLVQNGLILCQLGTCEFLPGTRNLTALKLLCLCVRDQLPLSAPPVEPEKLGVAWPPTPTPSSRKSVGPVNQLAPAHGSSATWSVYQHHWHQSKQLPTADLLSSSYDHLGTKPLTQCDLESFSQSAAQEMRASLQHRGEGGTSHRPGSRPTNSNQTLQWHGDPQPQEVPAWCVAGAPPTRDPCGSPIAHKPLPIMLLVRRRG